MIKLNVVVFCRFARSRILRYGLPQDILSKRQKKTREGVNWEGKCEKGLTMKGKLLKLVLVCRHRARAGVDPSPSAQSHAARQTQIHVIIFALHYGSYNTL